MPCVGGQVEGGRCGRGCLQGAGKGAFRALPRNLATTGDVGESVPHSPSRMLSIRGRDAKHPRGHLRVGAGSFGVGASFHGSEYVAAAAPSTLVSLSMNWATLRRAAGAGCEARAAISNGRQRWVRPARFAGGARVGTADPARGLS